MSESCEYEAGDFGIAPLWRMNKFQRVELAMKSAPYLHELGKENQRKAGGTIPEKADQPVDTRAELARIAGVSHDTVSKAEALLLGAGEPAIQRLRNGETSINREYRTMRNNGTLSGSA